MEAQKPYVVVRFEDEDDVLSEIPSNWLEGKDKCWWPTTKDISTLIAKRTIPNKENGKWKLHPITIQDECDDYRKARKNAAQEFTSDSGCDNKGRGRRKKIKRVFGDGEDTESVESSDADEPQAYVLSGIPEFPRKKAIEKEGGSQVEHRTDQLNNSGRIVITVPSATTSETSNVTSDITLIDIKTDDLIKEFKEYTEDQFGKILRLLGRLQLSVESLENKIKGQNSNSEDMNFDKIKEYLPLNTLDDLKTFETILHLKEDMQALLRGYYKTVGGTNLKEKTIRLLKRSFTNALVSQTSWLGQRQNFKMANLTIISIMKGVLIGYPDFDEKLFEDTVSDWLRQGKQRFQREKKN